MIKTSADRVRELEEKVLEMEAAAEAEANDKAEDATLSQEEKTFKKRYADLRSHTSKIENELKREIDNLKNQLSSATKKTIEFPKTAEEVQEWAAKYPDVYETIVTIARLNAIDVAKDTHEKVQRLEEREHEQAKREAYSLLLQAHSDFPDIATSQEFIDWVETQPKYIYEALYVNETDAIAAIRAVDLYKADTGTKVPAPKKEKVSDRGAASRVTPPQSQGTPNGSQLKWTESKLQGVNWNRLTDAQLAEIEEAQNDPAFYDLSGGAR